MVRYKYFSAKLLWKSGDEEDKKFFREIAADISHPENYEAAESLWRDGSEDEKHFLFEIAQNLAHPKCYEAAAYCLVQDGTEEEKIMARTALSKIALSSSHSNSFDAARDLFSSRIYFSAAGVQAISLNGGDESLKEIAYNALLRIARDPEHKYSYFAAEALWNAADDECRIYIYQIAQNPNHSYSYRAAV